MRVCLLASALLLASCDAFADDWVGGPLPPRVVQAHTSPPLPAVGPVPSPSQLAFQQMETNAFVHFGPNTFLGVEWGDGTASPDAFAPSGLDARQWAELFAEVGFRGVVLVTKHHDGFHLWPTRLSDYSVAQSPWRGGGGDLVREVAEAARATGLELGVYLSPWDRHHPAWGTPAYNDYFVAALAELIGPDGYARPFEVWLDGAYGLEVTRVQIDTYDLRRWHTEIQRLAPDAVIALDVDVFWPQNEDGVGPTTNWSVRDDFPRWAPYECDTSVRERTQWFWHPGDRPRPLGELVDVYFTSVGRACTLLLNVPPDRRGQISDADAARLRAWRAALDGLFDRDLARHAPAAASGVRDGAAGWAPGAAVDGDPASFWAADSTGDHAAWLEVDLGAPFTANVLELAEPIAFGQRIAAFRLEAWVGGEWTRAARGTTVNYKRLVRFAPVTAQRWRVVIESGRAPPALSTVALYAAPGWAARWARGGALD